MKRFTLLTCAFAFTVALQISLVSVSAEAQVRHKAVPQAKKDGGSELDKAMVGELGTMVTNYWMPKLNDYKTRIDRSLSAEDLDALNKLRVRFAILTSELMQSVKLLKASEDEASVDAKINPEDMMGRVKEATDIYMAAKEMAGRYRSPFDIIKRVVVTDVTDFAGQVEQSSNRFFDANRVQIEREKGPKFIGEGRKAIAKTASELRSEKGQEGVAMVYTSAIEPIVMLYNGSDLGQIFNQLAPMTPMTKPIAQTGILMPESAVLKQNVPNPASADTKIIYNLSEASTVTTIRLYSSNGTIVSTFDEGAQSVGQHERTVDVSGLPNGSYLYHLTVQTAGGERVYSRTMQVVR